MQLVRIGRHAIAVLLVTSMLALAGAAGADERDVHTDPGAESTCPVGLDVFVLRPVGLVGMFTGFALFLAPVVPLTIVSRPNEMGRPFQAMVVNPARYVFADPLGQH